MRADARARGRLCRFFDRGEGATKAKIPVEWKYASEQNAQGAGREFKSQTVGSTGSVLLWTLFIPERVMAVYARFVRGTAGRSYLGSSHFELL